MVESSGAITMIDLALQTKPRVAIETHGCKLNQADSGSLATEFA